MMEVHGGRDLGIADCNFLARGEAAGDVMRQMVAHLEEEHGMDMPDPDVILRQYPDEAHFLEELAEVFSVGLDKETQLIIRRLRQALEIDSSH